MVSLCQKKIELYAFVLVLDAELGDDKLESRMERGQSTRRAYRLMMRKRQLTSQVSIWKEVQVQL